jgi:hypothetical protein
MNRDRNTLRGFFTKGAIPSEENFADLIDSAINQNDDGISKLPNDPLRINASGPGDTVLNFYQKATDSKPAWTLGLNSSDASAKAGLNVSSIPGGSRLFIDYNSGNVGIGTASPATQLDIANGVLHVAGQVDPKATQQGAYLGWNILTGTGETDFINNKGQGPGGFAFMNTPSSGTPRTTLMFISGAGNVGIGTTTPAAKLDVAGLIRLGLDESESGTRTISFARDPGDEKHSGKIAYKPQWPEAGQGLHIVGAGPENQPRKIVMWDDVTINGGLAVTDRAYLAQSKNNRIDLGSNNTNWVNMQDMIVNIPAKRAGVALILFKASGVQATGGQTRIQFRLLFDDKDELDLAEHEWHNSGWELRDVVLQSSLPYGSGTHTVKVQWRWLSGTGTAVACEHDACSRKIIFAQIG